jgi:hypothetical protein
LTSENFFEILVLAYGYNFEQLKKAITKFLSTNRTKGHFTSLTMTKEWQDFVVENRELANEIMESIYSKMNTKY